LSTTNPTCFPDANPGSRCGKLAINHLSYGTAKENIKSERNKFWNEFKCLRVEFNGELFEHGNIQASSINCGVLFDPLNNYQLLE
jgi:hypothetical protein